MRRIITFAAMLALMLGLSACPPKKTVTTKPEPVRAPIEEQEKIAAETFNSMLEMTANVRRAEVLDELAAGYKRI